MKIINNSLKEIVKNGIDKNALRAGLNSLEFKEKEADFGGFPKGLIWGLNLNGCLDLQWRKSICKVWKQTGFLIC